MALMGLLGLAKKKKKKLPMGGLLGVAGKFLKKKEGGALKPVPPDNKGLAKLPTEVRNNMGFAKTGGHVKMKKGGKVKRMSCPVDGMAKRGKTKIRKKGK